ncbi:meiotically up-regulated gene family-domain-containing protein [Mycena vulgaris]|nr:meiotically up-regulated gene family-domain-containing protein [Mycena vulgaris]
MKFTQSFLHLASCLALAGSVTATNGTDLINCKGSSLCSGPLITAAQCQSAFNLIVPGNRYVAGGSASGTCSGHCGVFVQSYDGTGGCSVSGSQLQMSFNAIRADGCAKCGSNEFDNGCEVTINYVGSC